MAFSTTNTHNTFQVSTCRVCGDIAKCRAYGIESCYGCMSFFKRTLKQKLVYSGCVNSGFCIINRDYRRKCRSCRYAKCVAAGMRLVKNDVDERNNKISRQYPVEVYRYIVCYPHNPAQYHPNIYSHIMKPPHQEQEYEEQIIDYSAADSSLVQPDTSSDVESRPPTRLVHSLPSTPSTSAAVDYY